MHELNQAEAMCEIPELAKVAGVEDCTAVINGIWWRYMHAGSGPALLLVHGFMGYSFSWRLVIKGLAQIYSVYAVDLPGCGFSERNATLPGTMTSDAEHLMNFMDHVGIEQADVLGTSRGGGLTIAFAGLLAERGMLHRIRRLILSAPISPWSKLGLTRIRLLRTRVGRIYVVHLASRLPFILRDFFKKLYADPASIPPDSFAGYQAGLEPAGSFEHIWNITRSWFADLKRIDAVLPLVETIPALLLWGERDRAVDPASVHELHHRWKNSAVLIMNRIGHMPYEEVPEEFNRIVLDFLLRNAPETSLETEGQSDGQSALVQTAVESGNA
jgi:pimeloyl-ACP methyl ester carboxylesterase